MQKVPLGLATLQVAAEGAPTRLTNFGVQGSRTALKSVRGFGADRSQRVGGRDLRVGVGQTGDQPHVEHPAQDLDRCRSPDGGVRRHHQPQLSNLALSELLAGQDALQRGHHLPAAARGRDSVRGQPDLDIVIEKPGRERLIRGSAGVAAQHAHRELTNTGMLMAEAHGHQGPDLGQIVLLGQTENVAHDEPFCVVGARGQDGQARHPQLDDQVAGRSAVGGGGQ